MYLSDKLLSKELLTSNSEYLNEVRTLVINLENRKNIGLFGETGVGKTVLAGILHKYSNKSDKRFVHVHSYPSGDLGIINDLRGHKKGAFTGAIEDKEGILKYADGGVIFFDEIDRMPREHLDYLLNLIELKKYRIPGKSPKEIEFDISFIFGSNKKEEQLNLEYNFQSDLLEKMYQRKIYIKPLRERLEDLDLIIDTFNTRLNKIYNKSIIIHSEVKDVIRDFSWPRNLRQLYNILDEILEVAPFDSLITVNDINKKIKKLSHPNINFRLENLKREIKAIILNWPTLQERVPLSSLGEKTILDSIIHPTLAKVYYDETNQHISATEKNSNAKKIIGVTGVSRKRSPLLRARPLYQKLEQSFSKK